jgi:hypothetical protein
MKPLAQLNNVERAKLLFELFPREIPDFLAFQKAVTDNLLRDPDQLKDDWNNQIFTIDFWIRTASDVNKALERYSLRLTKSSRLFADQLFDGYNALYTAHCLQQYIKHKTPESEKFKTVIELLFT